MSAAKAGDPCCFCGEPLVVEGGRVVCTSVDDGVCVGRIRPQEEPAPSPRPAKDYRAVARAVLDNLEDRREIKNALLSLKAGSRSNRFVYARMEEEIGRLAFEAVEAILAKGADRP